MAAMALAGEGHSVASEGNRVDVAAIEFPLAAGWRGIVDRRRRLCGSGRLRGPVKGVGRSVRRPVASARAGSCRRCRTPS